jgi:dTDP-4-amino-4,6-dideoxygalactose transaminase
MVNENRFFKILYITFFNPTIFLAFMDKKILTFKHEHLVNSGNAAIFAALFMARQLGKTKVLIPKEGGWYSYKNYPKILGMEVIEVNADYALLDLEDLKKKIDDKSVILYSVIGGYFAKEPIKEIKKIAKENNALVLGDITAGFGNKTFMEKDQYDFAVASFGEHKPLNLGYGGIIASDYEIDQSILSLFKFPDSMKEELDKKLQELPKRLDHL